MTTLFWQNNLLFFFPYLSLKFKDSERQKPAWLAGWLQGQNSVMHLYMAQRVANRLDTEIRVLSRKLPEQMTAGLGGRRREAQPACSPLARALPALEDRPFLLGKATPQRGPPLCPGGTSLASLRLVPIWLVLRNL